MDQMQGEMTMGRSTTMRPETHNLKFYLKQEGIALTTEKSIIIPLYKNSDNTD